MSELDRLVDWYANQTNGDWEHQHGISIDTLDNPGWSISIDIAETSAADLPALEIRQNFDDENDWLMIRISDEKLKAFCGVRMLSKALSECQKVLAGEIEEN